MKLTIGIASYRNMEIETALSLALAVRYLKDEPRIHAELGPYVHFNRERLMQGAIQRGSSHLMFIDCDVIFPVNGIERLAALETDIAYAGYNRRNRFPLERLVDCTGFMLVNLESVKKIKRPWFTTDGGVGEDYNFCCKAREAGLHVIEDPSIVIGHKGEYTY